MSPWLSVIFPVLNNRIGFVRAIDQVLSLRRSDIEIVVIDGGSTDGTLEEIRVRESRISYWETGKDKGIADAFNRGVVHSSGTFIAILNSDDFWDVNALAAIEEGVRENSEGGVFYGAVRYVDNESGYAYIRRPRLSALKYRMWLFHPAMVVSRSAYERVGLYDECYTHAMDSEWCHRAIASGLSFVELDAVLANMSLGGVSDRQFIKSLSQYRRSVIAHGLCGPFEAWIFFVWFASLKLTMRSAVLRPFKVLRDKILNRGIVGHSK